MAVLVPVANGVDEITSENLNQLIELLQGLRNIPISLTGINDAASYTMTVKNAGTGSKDAIFYAANGTTVLFQVDGSGVLASRAGGAAERVLTVGESGTITASMLAGTITADKLSLATVSASLGVDTNLAANTNTQLLTVTPAAGTWIFGAGMTVNSPTAGTQIDFTIRDETTGGGVYISNGRVTIGTANKYETVERFSRPYTFAGTPTISLRAESVTNASTAYKTDGTYGGAGIATYLWGLRIG
jgi:hypothetical protein